MGLTMKEKNSVAKEVAMRYALAEKNEKTKILNEFTRLTGYARKYAIRKLRGLARVHKWRWNGRERTGVKAVPPPKRRKRGRKRKYGDDVRKSLSLIWRMFNMMCGQRLAPLIRENIDQIAAEPSFCVTADVRAKLARIGSATIDRLLRAQKARMRPRGTCSTKPAKNLNGVIPIRVCFDWDERKPGFFEVDTVSHDGGNASGEFCFTLTVTDVCTGWTELRPLRNKAHKWVRDALDDIRRRLPFPMLGVDSDNGSEFKNAAMVAWCGENKIVFTRSRPYKKNDNCFVEQKNDSVVRRAVGYVRYEGDKAVEALGRLYEKWCLLVNYFYPSLKIISKERVGAKVRKQYDAAKSPFKRCMESPLLTGEQKARLAEGKKKLGLVALKKEVDEALQAVWDLHL